MLAVHGSNVEQFGIDEFLHAATLGSITFKQCDSKVEVARPGEGSNSWFQLPSHGDRNLSPAQLA